MITAEDYDTYERLGSRALAARAVAAFAPVAFMERQYPGRVDSDQGLLRYVDTMHEWRAEDYHRIRVNEAERDLIAGVADRVAGLSESLFGRRIRPWLAPFGALPMFRVVDAFARRAGGSLSVFEIGPGSGFLGAFCLSSGLRHVSMDNTQVFYLWQARLFGHLTQGAAVECAVPGTAAAPDARSVHIPWWQFADAAIELPRADLVICDHALGEMSKTALRYVLRAGKQVLDQAKDGLFLFIGPGATHVSDKMDIVREFFEAGYSMVFAGPFFGFAPPTSSLFKFGARGPSMAFGDRVARKLQGHNFANTYRLPPLPDAALQALRSAVPAVGGAPATLSAKDVIPLDEAESPLDYPFLSRAGYVVPVFPSK